MDPRRLLALLHRAHDNSKSWDWQCAQAERHRLAAVASKDAAAIKDTEFHFARCAQAYDAALILHRDLRTLACMEFGWPEFKDGLGVIPPADPRWQHDPDTGEALWAATRVSPGEVVDD